MLSCFCLIRGQYAEAKDGKVSKSKHEIEQTKHHGISAYAARLMNRPAGCWKKPFWRRSCLVLLLPSNTAWGHLIMKALLIHTIQSKMQVQEWKWAKGLDRILRRALGKAQVRALWRIIGNYVPITAWESCAEAQRCWLWQTDFQVSFNFPLSVNLTF